jgi:hypothetical protein
VSGALGHREPRPTPCGDVRIERCGDRAGNKDFEGQIPGALSRRNKRDKAEERVTRQAGNQTRKADGTGGGKAGQFKAFQAEGAEGNETS